MELNQTVTQTNDLMSNVLSIANNALEFGLKTILPDAIENDVIEIKDKFIHEGFTEGIQEVLDKLEDVGKSIAGIFTGKFETVEQIKRVVQKDGLLDGISDVMDKVLKKLLDNKKIDKKTYNLIKTGKKEILSSMENNLEGLYKEDTYSLDKLSEHCEEWKKQYKEKDYEGMSKTMTKIKQKLNQNKVVEETINKARSIENIQKYIKEKGNIENLSEEQKELIEKIS